MAFAATQCHTVAGTLPEWNLRTKMKKEAEVVEETSYHKLIGTHLSGRSRTTLDLKMLVEVGRACMILGIPPYEPFVVEDANKDPIGHRVYRDDYGHYRNEDTLGTVVVAVVDDVRPNYNVWPFH